jgi:hypothetical protein
MYNSDFCDRIVEVAKSDQQKLEGYELKEDGILMYRRKVYVPNDQELKSLIL